MHIYTNMYVYNIYHIYVSLPISYLTAISDILSIGSITPWGKDGADAYNSIVLGPIILTIRFKSI